jgi:hypothetical protein
MKISIEYQYLPKDHARPIDGSEHNDPIGGEDGEFMPIPDVGDTVSYESFEYDYDSTGKAILDSGRNKTVCRKVLTRHFSYSGEDFLHVNIVVGDVSDGEMAKRLKE